ncbi:MAG TPA: GNAT family N-acetyltransferase [Symbiobacteriaceae bacterium]|jgi:GNAT superfamily N-acetyltransferase|nr:GNAT family N-acetyltransferase [Symbiobacteriaceae bacterium]
MDQTNHGAPRPFTVRPGLDADYPAMADLYNQTAPAPLTAGELAGQGARHAKAGPYVRLMLVDGAGAPRGFAMLWQEPWREPRNMNFTVKVAPVCHGQGGGGMLYEAVEEQARALGARVLDTFVRDDVPAWRTFAERRGYAEAEHFRRSALDLDAWDPAPFRAAVDRALAAGYRFIRLADEGPTEEAKRRLYELDMDCARDEPGMTDNQEWPPIGFEEYQRDLLTGPRFDPAGIFLAVKDGEWVALSGCHYPPEKPSADVFFTAVRRGHRGHGLAQACKYFATLYAKEKGIRQLLTSNHNENPAMLAVNRKFGFVPLPGSYVMRKELPGGSR